MAVLYSAWAGIVYVARGPEFGDTLGVTLMQVVIAYFGGGAAGGVIVGLMLAHARKRLLWAALTGYLASLPFFALVTFMMMTPQELRHPTAPLVPTALALFGAGVGAWIWWSENKRV